MASWPGCFSNVSIVFFNSKITRLQADLVSHQNYINDLNNKKLEKIKSELKINESRLVSLHTKRLDMIESTYRNLIDLKKSMERFVSYNPVAYRKAFAEQKQQIINDLSGSFKKYDEELLFSKIYFNTALASKLLKIGEDYNNAFSDINDLQYLVNADEMSDEEYRRLKTKRVLVLKLLLMKYLLQSKKLKVNFAEFLVSSNY